MKAMILAAGRGERMRPLTDQTPKPLLEVMGKPLIARHLEALAAAEFEQIVVNLSWLGDRIRRYCGDGSAFGVSIEYSEEPQALETAGGIRQALDLLGERFIVVNADVYTDYPFARLRGIDAQAHIVLAPNPAHNAAGDFAIDGNRVVNQGEPSYTFTGISAYSRSFFGDLEPGKRALAPLLSAAADQGRLGGEVYQGLWSDIGTPERLQELNQPASAN